MVQVRVRWADQAAGEGNDAAIARGVSGDKLRRQARALGEATDKYALPRYAGIHGELHHRPHLCQGRR